jgi:hypothetical protein
MRNSHSDTTNDENRLTAKAINVENGGNGGQEHDDAHNSGREQGEGSTNDSHTLEDERSYRVKKSSQHYVSDIT